MEAFAIWEIGLFFTVLLGFAGVLFGFKKRPKELPPPADSGAAENAVPGSLPSADRGFEPGAVPSPTAEPKALAEPVPQVKIKWTDRLGEGLSRTRNQLKRSLSELFVSSSTKATREQILESLFEVLIQADVGVETSEWLVNSVREKMKSQEMDSQAALEAHLKNSMMELLASVNVGGVNLESPATPVHVVMMVGVNGVGKTTTTGKLAHKSREQGRKVVIAAADTFRAAAVEQLAVWAERSGAHLWRMADKADPASVAFEAVRFAKSETVGGGTAICLIDTAGRLHNRNDLMQELAKIRRVTSKEIGDAPHEVLLVVDATTGQNAVMQAKVFREISGVTGVVLTKLDGTAKGGVALAIVKELGLPIRYVGVGESVEDLQPFNSDEFVSALLLGN